MVVLVLALLAWLAGDGFISREGSRKKLAANLSSIKMSLSKKLQPEEPLSRARNRARKR